MSATPLPLTLAKKESALDGIRLVELVPKERIVALINSDKLRKMWIVSRFHEKQLSALYATEKQQLEAYLKNYVKSAGGVVVQYKKTRAGLGRAYVYKSLGLTPFRRKTRNTLIAGIYLDFDIENAHPNILRIICESNQIACPKLTEYCRNRDNILRSVQDTYGVDRDQAKDLFIRICYMGTFSGWCQENGVSASIPALDCITLFVNEIDTIAGIIKKANKGSPLMTYAQGQNKGNSSGILGTLISTFNQEYEERILECVICHLRRQTDLMKYEGDWSTGTYEYDGIKLLASNVEAFGGVEAVVSYLNDITEKETGFKLNWVNKPIEGAFDLGDLVQEASLATQPNQLLYETCVEISTTISRSDCGIIELIKKLFPKNFIYSVDKFDASKGTWYGWEGTKWRVGESPLKNAIMYEVEKHWTDKMAIWDALFKDENPEEKKEDPNYKMWLETTKSIKSRLFQLHSSGGASACVSIAKALLEDNSLEFDTNPDLVGFNNGVFDISTATFRKYRFDDRITMTCGYDFTPYSCCFNMEQEDGSIVEVEERLEEEAVFRNSHEFIRRAFCEIMPDRDMLNFLVDILSTGFSGRAIEKFFIFNGSGRNGKGLTNEFMEVVLGDYFSSVSPQVFSEDPKKKATTSANPEVAKLNKKRYVVAKEPEKTAPLNNSTIKDMTGGGTTSARMLYSSNCLVRLHLTLVMECNKKPPFKEDPTNADAERIVDMLFGSKFSSNEAEWDITTGETNNIYPVSADLKEELKSNLIHRNTMANMLLVNLLKVRDAGYNLDAFKPECVRVRSLEYLQTSYDLHNIFQELFEKRTEENKDLYRNAKGELKDEDWTMPKIVKRIKDSKEFRELPKQKQKDYSVKGAIEEFLSTNGVYRNSVYRNSHTHAVLMRDWRLRPEEEEEEEEGEEK